MSLENFFIFLKKFFAFFFVVFSLCTKVLCLFSQFFLILLRCLLITCLHSFPTAFDAVIAPSAVKVLYCDPADRLRYARSRSCIDRIPEQWNPANQYLRNCPTCYRSSSRCNNTFCHRFCNIQLKYFAQANDHTNLYRNNHCIIRRRDLRRSRRYTAAACTCCVNNSMALVHHIFRNIDLLHLAAAFTPGGAVQDLDLLQLLKHLFQHVHIPHVDHCIFICSISYRNI